VADTEVVRRLTISATATGVDDTTASMNKLADASNNVAQVTDQSATRALSAEAAWTKLNNSLDPVAKSQAAIEKGTETLNAALAQGVITQDQYAASIDQLKDKYSDLGSANDDAKSGFNLTGVEVASTANHIRQAAEAAYLLSPAFRAMVNPAIVSGLGLAGSALAAMGPTASVAASAIGSALAPALMLVLRVAGPILLLVDAIKLVGFAWSSASDNIEKYNTLSTDAAKDGVSTTFLQSLQKAWEDMGGKISDATDLLNKFAQTSETKLGGSDLMKKIDSHIDAGNLDQGNGVNLFSDASDTESRMRAIVTMMDELVSQNKTLAAIDISETAFGHTATENFRTNTDYFKDMLASADAIAQDKLVNPQDVVDATNLKNRYDDAVKILSEQWIPFQSTINAAGMEMHAIWVSIVEDIASAFTGIVNVGKAISAWAPPDWLLTTLSTLAKVGVSIVAPVATLVAGTIGSLASTPTATTQGAGSPTDAQRQAGLAKLRSAMPNDTDTSNELNNQTKATNDLNDAVDRAINTLTRHTETVKADTQAVGLGDGALATFKAQAAETAAVQANGGEETAAQAASFKTLQIAAGNAADALAKAKVASDISRGSQTAFLSPEDVQIANTLKGIYGNDIPAALNSAQAAALRMNNVLSTINTTVRDGATTFAQDFVGALVKGQSLMSSLQTAAASLGKTLLDAGLKSLVTTGLNSLSGPASSLASSAGLTAGATTAAATITAAGTAAGAAIAAGGTAAAAALGTGGTVAGTAVTAGGATAGTTVAAGGTAAGVALDTAATTAGAALWGPIAALAAVGAGIGLSMFGASSGPSSADKIKADQQLQQQVDQQNQGAQDRQVLDAQNGQLAGIDQTTLQGQLQAFDISSQQQREAEAKAGNGAIVELEQSLAAQRLAIIQKSNTAIETTMTDFLTSLKTGSLSILSPQDQLNAEQTLFNTQLAGAQGGNSDDLNALTTTAQSLLTLAQNFYASGTGYADTYNQVTSAISALAGNVNQTTFADQGVTSLSDVVADVNSAHDGIASAIGLAPGTVPATDSLSGMAEGGIVGNGVFNKDSVVARYAGGGSIALAGGEAVTRASSVNAQTIGALNYINKNGKTPSNNNDDVVRVLTQGFNGQTTVLGDKLDTLASRVKSLEDTTRQTNNKRRVPGTRAA
jgi:hypothetical protein